MSRLIFATTILESIPFCTFSWNGLASQINCSLGLACLLYVVHHEMVRLSAASLDWQQSSYDDGEFLFNCWMKANRIVLKWKNIALREQHDWCPRDMEGTSHATLHNFFALGRFPVAVLTESQPNNGQIPYGQKFWRGIYFGRLAVLRAIRQYFFCQNLCNHIVFPLNKPGCARPID